MDPLAMALAERGFVVRRVALEGHYGPAGLQHQVTASGWLENVRAALESLHEKFEPADVHVVGFSLGGTIPLVLSKRSGEPRYSRAVLIAPAIAIAPIAAPLRALSRVTSAALPLPSLAPRDIRAHSTTSLAEYRALFELSDELGRARELSTVLDVPTLVLVSSNDALVSGNGIRRWIEESGMSKWTIEMVEASGRTHFGHVIFHPRAFEEKEWRHLVERIAGHLSPAC